MVVKPAIFFREDFFNRGSRSLQGTEGSYRQCDPEKMWLGLHAAGSAFWP
jgi:hypothetical protein